MKKVSKIIQYYQKKIIRQTRMFCRALKSYRKQMLRLYKKDKKLMIKKWNYSLLIFQRVWLKKTRRLRYFLAAWRGQIRQSFYVGEKRLNVLNLTLLVCMFLISGISFTGSYFSDDEISTDNHWQMAKLEINSSGSNFAPLVSNTQIATTSVDVVNDGNLKLKYTTTVQNVGGDLCSYLDMRIYASSSQIFGGILNDGMILPDITLASSSIWQYDFETILISDDENLQNENCSFDLIFKSWQEELPDSTAGGYTDETSVHLIVNSGEWEDEEEPVTGCTLTQGYWKTHSSDDVWDLLEFGENTIFFLSTQSYIEVLETSSAGGNAYYQLAHQYIAAKLNELNGASMPAQVQTTFASSTVLFNSYTPTQIGSLAGNDPVRQEFISLADILVDYNEGEIGPGHCCDE
jgi:hypothetical protein